MKRYYFLFLVLASITAKHSVFAQFACFNVDKPKGCVPLTINLSDCSSGGSNLKYQYDAGNLIGKQSDTIPTTTYLYDKPGVYKIVQWGSFGSVGDSTSQYVTVLPTPTPQFTVSYCQLQRINLKITDAVYDQYTIDWKDGSPVQSGSQGAFFSHVYSSVSTQNIQITGLYNGIVCGKDTTIQVKPFVSLTKPDWITLEMLNPTTAKLIFYTPKNQKFEIVQQPLGGLEQTIATFNNEKSNVLTYNAQNLDPSLIYNFRIKTSDECGNSVYSDKNNTTILNVTPLSNQLQISWQGFQGNEFVSYILLRDSLYLTSILDKNQTTYIDKDIKCGREYCYKLYVQFKQEGQDAASISLSRCGTAIFTIIPTQVNNLTATVKKQKPYLQWQKPTFPVKKYIISKSEAGQGFQEYQTTLNLFFNDSLAAFEGKVCYKINYEDSCGNRSYDSKTVCLMYLSENTRYTPPTIEWTSYDGSQPVQNYTVEKLDSLGNVYETLNAGLNLNSVLDLLDKSRQTLRFRIKAVTSNFTSFSNILTIVQDVRLAVPNAFSPNGDNLNESFRADGIFINTFKMVIYNRWGESIFATEKLNEGWDGNINGQPAQPDTYAYVVEAKDYTGKNVKRNGTFILIR